MQWKNILNEAIDRARRGELAEAVVLFEQVLKIEPEYSKAHYNRACALSDLGRINEALAGFTEALQLNPDYVNAYLNRGESLPQGR